MKKSRLETVLKVKKKHPDMPETCGLEFILEHMLRCGPGLNSGYGLVPLTYTEIDAYDKLAMLSMTERNYMRDLSRAYVGQLNISSAWNCPAPWVKGVDDIETHNIKMELENAEQPAKIATLRRRKN